MAKETIPDNFDYIIDKNKGKMAFWDRDAIKRKLVKQENDIIYYDDGSITCFHAQWNGACLNCIEKVKTRKKR